MLKDSRGAVWKTDDWRINEGAGMNGADVPRRERRRGRLRLVRKAKVTGRKGDLLGRAL